jgi:hypothetical protein
LLNISSWTDPIPACFSGDQAATPGAGRKPIFNKPL